MQKEEKTTTHRMEIDTLSQHECTPNITKQKLKYS